MEGTCPQQLKDVELQLWQVILCLAQSHDGHALKTLKMAFEKIDALLGRGVDVAGIDWFDGGRTLSINLLLKNSDNQSRPYQRK
jgi:hypothetical protein